MFSSIFGGRRDSRDGAGGMTPGSANTQADTPGSPRPYSYPSEPIASEPIASEPLASTASAASLGQAGSAGQFAAMQQSYSGALQLVPPSGVTARDVAAAVLGRDLDDVSLDTASAGRPSAVPAEPLSRQAPPRGAQRPVPSEPIGTPIGTPRRPVVGGRRCRLGSRVCWHSALIRCAHSSHASGAPWADSRGTDSGHVLRARTRGTLERERERESE